MEPDLKKQQNISTMIFYEQNYACPCHNFTYLKNNMNKWSNKRPWGKKILKNV